MTSVSICQKGGFPGGGEGISQRVRYIYICVPPFAARLLSIELWESISSAEQSDGQTWCRMGRANHLEMTRSRFS